MKKSKLLLILALVVVLALGVLVSCKEDCAHENYGAWQITKAPTLTDAGEAVRICADCNVADTATVAKLSDTSVWTPTTTSATHTTAGKTTYTSTYGTVEISVDRLVDHVYDKEVAESQFLVSAADCTNAAVYRKSCVCGAVDTATFTSGTALGHNGKEVAAVAAVHTATTLTNGTKAHYECERCGKLFSDAACATEVTAESLVITATHSFAVWTLVSEPTCTKSGSQTHKCTGCDLVETVAIAALGHDFTKGIILPVNPDDGNQTWDGDEYDEEGYDVASSTTHAPVCDRCHTVVVDNAVPHDYTGAEEFFVIEDNDTISSHIKCGVCGHIADGTTNITGVISEYTVVADESEAATYTKAGYTTYTKEGTSTKFTVVEPKLVAIYEGKTYTPLEISRKDGVVASTTSAYHWNAASITVDSLGKATGKASPFSGDVVITMVDDTTGAITLTVGNSTYAGYVEPKTGIMVISDDGFASAYIVSPYEMTLSSAVGSYWTKAMALSYHVDCGTYLGHDIGIFINDDEVIFGVTFEDVNGALVAADECYSSDVLVVKADGIVITTFVKNSNNELQLADEYRGTYDAMAYGSKIGELDIDGIGGFVLRVTDGTTCSGIYSASATEGAYDAYVIWSGNKVAYYVSTIDVEAGTITLNPQTINITLNTGDKGTVDQITGDVYANCVVYLPTPTANSGYEFIGWFTANGSEGDWGVQVTDEMTFDEDITLYAKFALAVNISVVDPVGGDKTLVYGDGVMLASKLPAYTNTTVNSENNTIFDGWYNNAEFSGDSIEVDEVSVGASDHNTLTLYAHWVPAGKWHAFKNDQAGFEYIESESAWKTITWGNSFHSTFIEAINGDIVVSFKYWVVGGSTEVSWIKNNDVTIASKLDNSNQPAQITVVVKSGTSMQLQTKYWTGSSADDESGVWISDMTINGIEITKKGLYDLLADTYTCEGEDDLVIDGVGNFTWGTKSGTYLYKNDTTLELTVMSDTKAVEGYAVTLTDNVYVAETIKVNITLHFGSGTYPTADKVGDTVTTPQVVEVEIYKSYVLPTAVDSYDGKVFLGWYTTANGAIVITEVVPTGNTEVYGRYVDSIVVKYNDTVNNYVNKEVASPKSTALGSLLLVPEITTDGDKVFVGWFTKDGTGADWGTEVTATSSLSADTTVYAKWVVPHALTGYYQGLQVTSSGLTANSSAPHTFQVRPDGTIVSSSSYYNGKTLVDNGDGTYLVFASQYSKYYVKYDADNEWLLVSSDSSSSTPTTLGSSPFVYKKVDSNDTNIIDVANSKKLFTVDGMHYFILNVNSQPVYAVVGGTTFNSDVTIEVLDKTGTQVTDLIGASLNTNGYFATISYGETNLKVGYKSSWKVCTMASGLFETADQDHTVWLNGVGVVMLDGTEGTATAVADTDNQFNLSFTSAAYILTVNTTDNTCTLADDKVTLTFDFGDLDASKESIQVYRGVTVYLWRDIDAPVIEGYTFRGWCLTSTGSTTTTKLFTADATVYAKYDKAVTITYNYTGAGLPDTVVTGKYANDTIGTLQSVTNDMYPGHKFDKWYSKDGSLTGDWGTEIKTSTTLTDDITVYAKWLAAVTITYKYDVDGVADVVVSGYFVNDKPSSLQTVDASINPGFKFEYWCTKNEDGSWGSRLYTSTTLTGDLVVYAKWLSPVTATFDFLVDGVTNETTSGKYEGDSVDTLPTATAEMNPGKSIEGWYTKNGTTTGDWGTKITTNTKLTEDVTFYAKWITPPAMTGSYKGLNMCGNPASGTMSLSAPLEIDTTGKLSSSRINGTIPSESLDVAEGAIYVDRYVYVNKALGIVWCSYYNASTKAFAATAVGDDTMIYFDTSRVNSVEYSGSKDTAQNSYTAYLTITYKDGSTVNVFCYNSVIYANVSWNDGVAAKDANGTTSLTIKNSDGVTLFTKEGSTITAA